jgi:phosphoserine phosphatase RsbU/P
MLWYPGNIPITVDQSADTAQPGFSANAHAQRAAAGGVEVTVPLSRARPQDRLPDIQAITDTTLSDRDDRQMLAELLERTRAILQADTAAVLVLDASARELTAMAGAGLEEEIGRGVPIPVGRGFAGRVAAGRKPVIVNQVDHTTVLNPLLLAKGIQALVGVPLIVGGNVIGVLRVGSVSRREFSDDDVELLQLAADRAAAAVHSLMMRDERAAAAVLQRSLLPGALPATEGAEMAVRYVPGEGPVGGDWYDVFTLPTGQLGIVIGDVAGRGLSAAVIMGRIRSALRAYALDACDPAEVLSRLDRKIQHFEPGALATVSYAVFDRGLDRARICSAGHYPPVIAAPGQPAELANVPSGLLIGAAAGARRQTTTIDITPGTLLCFYTDGLIERRGHTIDDSLDQLCQAVTPQPPEAACAAVMAALVGSQPTPDDITLLMFRRQPSEAR